MDTTKVDITPHPKILSVLGEIEFKPWQCVAELVDNSVDGFLRMMLAETPIEAPTVRVAFGRDTVTVKDNGPGMSLKDLENAVKAGWTSNEPFGNLGLYGVGFNIATARLGSLTTIWTTQAGDTTWYGLEIDLQEISRQEHYQLEVKTRIKSDHTQSGTEVVVTKIRPDWKDSFNNSSWIRTNITDRLASIYGTMLRDLNPQPIKFSLYMNNKKVPAWEHCVWPAELTVYRKEEGDVRPIQEIDMTFGEKYISRSTGTTYNTREDYEQEGIDATDIVVVPERVYGWIGIQRYADEKEFGIDILRNGRKIEVGCKDLFTWEQEDGDATPEYPIDDPRHRGRIVGELHLDHGYVHYTKHRFEREHSSWKQLLQAVRNNEPLTIRDRQGYAGVNTSPLGILFRTFRRNSPSKGQKWADILFIKENEKAKGWAKECRKGNQPYCGDQFWEDELQKCDETQQPQSDTTTASDNNDDFQLYPGGDSNKVGTSSSESSQKKVSSTTPTSSSFGEKESKGNRLFPDVGTTTDTTLLSQNNGNTNSVPSKSTSTVGYLSPSQGNGSSTVQQSPRKSISELSFHITGIGITGRTYDVETFDVNTSTIGANISAWKSRLTERGVYEIEVNRHHPAFNSTSLQVRDAVLTQIAYLITFEENATATSQNAVNYSDILVELRKRYAIMDSLDINYLRMEINGLRTRITMCLSKFFTEDKQRSLVEHLSSEEVQKIELQHVRGPQNISLVTYFEMKHLAKLLEKQPEIFFEDEARCFNQLWNPPTLQYNMVLLLEHRKGLTREILMLVEELGLFMDDSTSSSIQKKSYLALIRACINRLKEYLTDEHDNVRNL